MPKLTAEEKELQRRQQEAIGASNRIVDRHVNQLKKAQQAAGNGPLALDGESFRKDFKYDVAQAILFGQGLPCPPKESRFFAGKPKAKKAKSKQKS